MNSNKKSDTLSQLERLVKLGWPGIVTVMVFVVFSLYVKQIKERLDYLQIRYDYCINLVIQIQRSYPPLTNFPEPPTPR